MQHQRKLTLPFLLAAAVGMPSVAFTAPVEAPTAASASGRDLSGLASRWGVPLTFNSFDANKDGYVSREEARSSPALTSQFDQLDRDGDGRLSPDELGAAAHEAPASAMGATSGDPGRSH